MESCVQNDETPRMAVHGASKNSTTSCGQISSQKFVSDEAQNVKCISFTLLTSTGGDLSKRLALNDNGKIRKTYAYPLSRGRAEMVSVHDLKTLSQRLLELRTDQALAFGVTGREGPVPIVTKKKWREMGEPHSHVTRSGQHFRYPDGPGVMVFDYDPQDGQRALTRDELVYALRDAVPAFLDASMLWWCSSSSCIYNDAEELAGIRGQRLYTLVKDAQDIPRAAKALETYLWAAGYGHIFISRSGAMLERCLFDMAMYQPERLDFAAGAICAPPLTQKRGEPVLIPGKVEIIDTRVMIPEPDKATQDKAQKAIRDARHETIPQCKAIKEQYIHDEALKIAGNDAEEEEINKAMAILVSAVESRTLRGEFVVPILKDGNRVDVTVGEILDNPSRYHNALTLDPLEPEYNNSKQVGKIFLYSGSPVLYSQAHGGRSFRLLRQPARIQLVQGRTNDATRATQDILRECPFIYDMGDSLVEISNGQIFPLDRDSLRYVLGGMVQYYHMKETKDGLATVFDDVPIAIVNEILAIGSRRRLKPLKAICTAPTITPAGRLLTRPGYDADTQILLDLDDVAYVPETPTLEQCATAFDELMKPFASFPFAEPIDETLMVCAILSAAVRPTIPTCPAFGFDAPVQGSGKTLLASCVAALASNTPPAVWPHTSGRDDEEVRKRVFTALREGKPAIIWDNILGIFDSAALASALTAENFTDRILGKSGSATVPNKAVFFFTGNNLCLAGDLPRRVLKCRIDPKTERPFARKFDMNPLAYVIEHRQKMIRSALTLIRGALSMQNVNAPGSMASFEDWDKVVRQTACWISAQFLHDPDKPCDPMVAIDEAQATDPEQETLLNLLSSLHDIFKDEEATAKKIIDATKFTMGGGSNKEAKREELEAAIENLSASRKIPSPASLGRLLTYRKDRIVGGYVLRCRSYGGKKYWSVKYKAA